MKDVITTDGTSEELTLTVNVQAVPAQCNDGIDNDQDGKIDFPADPGCTSLTDNDETDPIVTPNPQCSDGIDNDGDGKIDYPADKGCSSATDNDEKDPKSSGGGGGYAQCADGKDNDNDGLADKNDPGCHFDGNASNASSYEAYDSDELNGEVLGAETSCGIYVDKFLRKGYKSNDLEAVGLVQQFLNDFTKAGLVVDKNFGPKTEAALKNFQLAHKDKILTPWNLTVPTGIFYLTTQTEVNNVMCPTLTLPVPTNLIPFSANPIAPKI